MEKEKPVQEKIARCIRGVGVMSKQEVLLRPIEKILQHINITWFIRPSTSYVKHHLQGNLVVCEIGSYKGLNVLNMLHVLPIQMLYVVDPYTVYDDGSGSAKETQEQMNIIFNDIKTKVKKYPVTFIRKYSNEAIDDIPMVDFCYIDGDHTYEWVKKDIENYWPKIKEGGVLGGHDFTSRRIGLIRAVLEFVEKEEVSLLAEGSDWWVVKHGKN